ncbi:DUF4124 domain-containing protein [Marinobacter sp. X15-166B]|uniref:DUF4124 domain-containing protein n=1 Tax=Marinobacter sp. X15-166B TaxID=1897620 RepID=UPI00085CCDCD|nr:DUF4124 domain-containing protein [Marinobacter sp. X15-166B]OEY66667.1 hypothetical protein BG841_09525 [Marinobacter sp. X15-166B]
MIRKTLLLAATLALAPALSSASPVYTWTDEHGITHFGDRQPPGTRAEPINMRTPKPARSGNDDQTSPQQRLQQLHDRQGAEAENARLQAQQEAQEKQRQATCAAAEENLRILRTRGRIRIEENGEQRYLTPEEIDEKRVTFETIASESCSAEL